MTDDNILRAAQTIDRNAFRQKEPSEAMIRRQNIAIRKAGDVLAEASAERDALIAALEAAHAQVDALLALVASWDKNFFPSETELWPEIVRRNEILRRYGIEQK